MECRAHWENSRQSRRRLYPLGMFSNAYTDRLLGPTDAKP